MPSPEINWRFRSILKMYCAALPSRALFVYRPENVAIPISPEKAPKRRILLRSRENSVSDHENSVSDQSPIKVEQTSQPPPANRLKNDLHAQDEAAVDLIPFVSLQQCEHIYE